MRENGKTGIWQRVRDQKSWPRVSVEVDGTGEKWVPGSKGDGCHHPVCGVRSVYETPMLGHFEYRKCEKTLGPAGVDSTSRWQSFACGQRACCPSPKRNPRSRQMRRFPPGGPAMGSYPTTFKAFTVHPKFWQIEKVSNRTFFSAVEI